MSGPAVRVLAPPRWNPAAIRGHLARLLEHRDLLLVLGRHRINVRYKQSLLGGFWALLQPLAMMLVFTLVFARLVKVPSDGVPYPVFAYAGLLPWTFFSTAVGNGTASLVSHAHLVRKVYFPREILPFSYIIAAATDLLIASLALVALVAWFQIPLTPGVVVLLPVMTILGGFALACGLILCAIQVRFRDVSVALPVALQLWMFASPVLYPLSSIPAQWRPLYLLNPVAGLVDTFRRSVLGLPLDVAALATAAIVTAVLLPVAYVVFKHVEATVADII
jgi:lipopolysaccharide transport system permease protein